MSGSCFIVRTKTHSLLHFTTNIYINIFLHFSHIVLKLKMIRAQWSLILFVLLWFQVRFMERSTPSLRLCPPGETRCCWRLRCSSPPLKVRHRWSGVHGRDRPPAFTLWRHLLNVNLTECGRPFCRGGVPLGRHRAEPEEEDLLQQSGRIRQHLQLQRPGAHRVQPWSCKSHSRTSFRLLCYWAFKAL